ncbi:hypothetical protein [Heyndrickxia faecalis]|uniref:hypothetical protein n=1 Tax=Heyndrickxia faecalis TaxID=2824910 RepID=UPI0032B2E23C
MNYVVVTDELSRACLDLVSYLEERGTPDYEGIVVAGGGDDISQIKEITIDTCPEEKLVYFDEGAKRYFIVRKNFVQQTVIE